MALLAAQIGQRETHRFHTEASTRAHPYRNVVRFARLFDDVLDQRAHGQTTADSARDSENVTRDDLLGRVDAPDVAMPADPLSRYAARLSDRDRALAQDFLRMLAERAEEERENGK